MKKLIAENQVVGNGRGMAIVRDLYEVKNTSQRISVAKSRWFWVIKEDRALTPDQLIAKYPIAGTE